MNELNIWAVKELQDTHDWRHYDAYVKTRPKDGAFNDIEVLRALRAEPSGLIEIKMSLPGGEFKGKPPESLGF